MNCLQFPCQGRVDSVNMHETGILRLGFAQVRVPCRQAHFYHLRHSYKDMARNEWPIQMDNLQLLLNEQWKRRMAVNFGEEARQKLLTPSSVESFADFDRCMMAINEEHWSMRVSRCLTPHVCYSRLAKSKWAENWDNDIVGNFQEHQLRGRPWRL